LAPGEYRRRQEPGDSSGLYDAPAALLGRAAGRWDYRRPDPAFDRIGRERRHHMGPQSSAGIKLQDGVGGNSPVNRGRFATTPSDRLRILEQYRRIGMVGLSSNPFRPSHFAALYLIAEGYDVVPVNPREAEVLGRQSYASLSAIPGG